MTQRQWPNARPKVWPKVWPKASLNVTFPNGATRALRPGEPLVVLGANGAGKTRFARRLEKLNSFAVRLEREDDETLEREASRPPSSPEEARMIEKIWSALFAHRRIDVAPNRPPVAESEAGFYQGAGMSAGEQAVIWLARRAVALPPGALFIIDEPERHIQKAAFERLWNALEDARPDCAFVYVTLDVDFAVSRRTTRYVWVKGFDGRTSFDYEFFDIADYPRMRPEILLEIVGAHRKILFVEGTRDSLDYALYQEVYRNAGYHVLPVGGCQDVIACMKAKTAYADLDAIHAVGLIDRDHREEDEIAANKLRGVFSLGVAEVENLFVAPELLAVMVRRLGLPEGTLNALKAEIVRTYESAKKRQAADAFRQDVIAEIRRLGARWKDPEPEAALDQIRDLFSEDRLRALLENRKAAFPDTRDVRVILRVLNEKSLVAKVGELVVDRGREYAAAVISLLRTGGEAARTEIVAALTPYLPSPAEMDQFSSADAR